MVAGVCWRRGRKLKTGETLEEGKNPASIKRGGCWETHGEAIRGINEHQGRGGRHGQVLLHLPLIRPVVTHQILTGLRGQKHKQDPEPAHGF